MFHGDNGTLTVDLSRMSAIQKLDDQFAAIISSEDNKKLGTFEFKNCFLQILGDTNFLKYKNLQNVVVGEGSSLILDGPGDGDYDW